MYGIALSVAACLRGGTRVDVAWNLDPDRTPRFDPTEAVGITPGGGKLGGLLGGALDSRLVEIAAAKPSEGRIVEIELDPLEAEIIGVGSQTPLRIMAAPADTLPIELWDELIGRAPVGLTIDVQQGRATEVRLEPDDGSGPSVTIASDQVLTRWRPTPTVVVLGSGPMADALARAADLVGWTVRVSPQADEAIGLATSLSPIDSIVVLGHDTEAVGRVLQAALGSAAGYIGSIGPASLQEARGDWLAFRGITDTSRVRGPAGIDIGARRPEEVAVSVLAEMIATHNLAAP